MKVELRELLEGVPCPLCGSDISRDWGSEHGYRAVKCSECGLVYVNPRPALAAITEANKVGQHRTEAGELNIVFRRSGAKLRLYRKLIGDLFKSELRSGRPLNWLDIGAGFGEVMEALTQIAPPGSTIEGLEPMLPKAEEARARGLAVSTAPLSSLSGPYDQVSLINVFSHLPDFDNFLAEIRRVMAPGGTLLIETGNGGDLDNSSQYPDRLFLPDHLAFAGIDHMTRFLKRNDFEVRTILARRRDSFSWMAKNAIKRLLGRDAKLSVPYSSPFRTVFFKSRLVPLTGKSHALGGTWS